MMLEGSYMSEISFIIPIYCAEIYLEKLIESLQSQTFKDWEAILIDDGSTDKSGKMCDNISRADLRFRVFHQKNKGVGMARNKGMEMARGQYIHFLDADDYFAPHMAEMVITSAKNL